MSKFSAFLEGFKEGAIDAAKYAAKEAFGGASYKLGMTPEILREAGESTAKQFIYSSPYAWKKHVLLSLPSKVVKETPGKGFFGYSLSKNGYGIMLGAAATSIAQDEIQRHNREMLGPVSGVQETPLSSYDYSSISEYDTGASGDLVFALNKLR